MWYNVGGIFAVVFAAICLVAMFFNYQEKEYKLSFCAVLGAILFEITAWWFFTNI